MCQSEQPQIVRREKRGGEGLEKHFKKKKRRGLETNSGKRFLVWDEKEVIHMRRHNQYRETYSISQKVREKEPPSLRSLGELASKTHRERDYLEE